METPASLMRVTSPAPPERWRAEGLSSHKERMGGIAIAYEELVLGRLPVVRADRMLRSVVKRAIGFKDANEAAMAR